MRLVLFDIDGTLLRSGGCGRAATELALREVFGTAGHLNTVNFAGKTDWRILREALVPAGINAADIDAKLSEHNTAATKHLRRIIADFPVEPCPGAPEIVAILKTCPDVIIGLVTGNSAGIVPVKLRAAGYNIADFPVAAYGLEGIDRAELPPLALRRAIALTGYNFPAQNIVILGDTPGDIACAASISARTIAVATGPYALEQLRLCRPNHLFETLTDKDKVLSAILDHAS